MTIVWSDIFQDTLIENEELSPDGDMATSVDQELPIDEADGAESDTSARAGSTGAVDRTDEDFNRNERVRSTGFMGKNSEIAWVQRVKQESRYHSPQQREVENNHRNGTGPTLPDLDDGFSVSDSSYHLDDFSISLPETVDAYELPAREMADQLFNVYLSRIHPTFPIIGRSTFTAQFRRVMTTAPVNTGDKWLAVLNLLFAVTARYSHLVQVDWQGDERDHLIYFTRARMLSMNGESIFNHPDLQHIQVAALMSLYLLAVSQINRYVTSSKTLQLCLTNTELGPWQDSLSVERLHLASMCAMILPRCQTLRRRFVTGCGGQFTPSNINSAV